MSKTPYVGFDNDSLSKRPKVKAGERIVCPLCGGAHELKDSDPPMLLFYKCGDKTFLGGVDGRLTAGLNPDYSGSVDLSADDSGHKTP